MLKIRKATAKDAFQIWELRKLAILDQCSGHYPMDILTTWTSGEVTDKFIADVVDSFYVAVNSKQVLGCGMLDVEAEKLDAIFVHPGYMRMGIGKKIVNFLEEIAVKQCLKTLHLKSTLNAVVFYQSCGFEGIAMATYHSPRGIALACIDMLKKIDCDPGKKIS